MAKKHIISVELEIPGDLADYKPFDSNVSLADADVVIFSPDVSTFLNATNDKYLGKPALSEGNSFAIKERINHWKNELNSALKSGKTVFLFLEEFVEFYIDSGNRTHSGTGRNQKTTILVNKTNNYSVLPFPVNIRGAVGKKMFVNNDFPLIKSYFNEFKNESSYKIIIESEVSRSLLQSKDKSNCFSAVLSRSSNEGTLILLPYLEIDYDQFLIEQNDEFVWNKKAFVFGNRLIKELLELDKFIKQSTSKSIAPSWVADTEFDLAIEKESFKKLNEIEDQIEKLSQQKQIIKETLEKETSLKDLLYENGKPLEYAVLQALSLMGFKANNYNEEDSEFDVVFESVEGRLLGEVEGKDNKAVNVDKLRQLEMNIHEDFEREEVTQLAKGVLFANSHRLIRPSERKEFFTEKCKIAADRSQTALIRSTDLFIVARYLKSKKNSSFAKKCREAIFTTKSGEVVFPKLPKERNPKKIKKDFKNT